MSRVAANIVCIQYTHVVNFLCNRNWRTATTVHRAVVEALHARQAHCDGQSLDPVVLQNGVWYTSASMCFVYKLFNKLDRIGSQTFFFRNERFEHTPGILHLLAVLAYLVLLAQKRGLEGNNARSARAAAQQLAVVSDRHVDLQRASRCPAVHSDVSALLRGVVVDAENVAALSVTVVACLADEGCKIVTQCIVHHESGGVLLALALEMVKQCSYL